jgi:hypothetical protein
MLINLEFKIPIREKGEFDKKRLMIFGVNTMSTENVEEYFNYSIKKIYWINDFTCIFLYNLGLVEFGTEEEALKIFEDFTGTKVDKDGDLFEQFNWKPTKTYKENELLLRVSEKHVRNF